MATRSKPSTRLNHTRGTRRPRRRGLIALNVAAAVLSVIYVYPFLVTVANSLKTNGDATNSALSLIPDPLTFDAYSQIFSSWFPRALFNSVVVTGSVTVARAFLDALAGYALARLSFPGRRVVFSSVIAVLAVPGVVLLIPRFLVVYQLGIYDTYPGMIIPLLCDAAGIFIMKNYFDSIPVSMEEAARIDGAGPFRTFWSVVMPMAMPAVVTVRHPQLQGSWNELSHFIVSAQNPDLAPLPRLWPP